MLQPKRFHLGWFVNFTVNAWNETWADNNGPDWTGGFYVDMARALERTCFDYMILEDTCMVSDAYGGSFETSLKHAVFAPKHDPMPLVPLLAQATSRLGVVGTMSTSFYPPFLLARLSATLDHICQGRFGWNIVTSGEDRAAQNFGMEQLTEHDLRYDIADEYVDLVCQLWDSWGPRSRRRPLAAAQPHPTTCLLAYHDIAIRASIMASATPFWCCATPKHLTAKSGMISKP